MSTKTNFKRIALVAVAALGLGVLSSVPSQADVTNLAVSATNGTANAGAKNDSTTAAIITVTGFATTSAGDSVTVNFVNKGAQPGSAVPYIVWLDTATASGNASPSTTVRESIASVTAADRASTSIVDSQTVSSATNLTMTTTAAGYMGARFAVQLESSSTTLATAGTYSYTALVTSYKAVAGSLGSGVQVATATADFTIVIAAAASASTTVDASKSTAFLGGSVTPTADAAVSAEATASSTAAAHLAVRTYNAASGAAGESITVTISGAGSIFHTNTSVGGTSITVKSAGGTDGDFQIRPDGRAGVATITVKTTSTTFSNKSVNFYSAAAKTITATVGTPLLAVGANTGAVRGVAVDANGVAWTGQAYIVASSATDALVGGSATTPVACATYDTVNARHNCPITTLTTGTAKFKIIDASTVAAATATSNEVTVTVSAATPATVKLEFDKATYAPNERARIYITPLDSTGKAMQSAVYTNMLASGGLTVIGAVTYTGTTTTVDSLTAATGFTTAAQNSSTSGAKAGSMQFTVYMPASGGTVTLSATGGSSLPVAGQVALTATATVTDSGSAALAAVTALATTVASLKTLITTLTNLVLKIQKKVKA
jgi:hypothetical protein